MHILKKGIPFLGVQNIIKSLIAYNLFNMIFADIFQVFHTFLFFFPFTIEHTVGRLELNEYPSESEYHLLSTLLMNFNFYLKYIKVIRPIFLISKTHTFIICSSLAKKESKKKTL